MNRTSIKATSFQMLRALLGILFLWASSPLLDAQTKDTTTLTVRVTGARNTKGKIGVTLFQDAQGFPDDTSKAIRQQSAEIDPKTMSAQITFKDVPPGHFRRRGSSRRERQWKDGQEFCGDSQGRLRRFQQP